MFLRVGIFFIFLTTLFFSRLIWADQLIIEPEMGRAPVINAIKNARHTIDLVMYGWTDNQLLDNFIQQKRNGRTINVILEEKPYKREDENNKTITLLKENDINWIGNVPPFRLIHQKTLIIDDKKALVMTFNFTRSTFKNERNFALLIDDPKTVREIANVFSADWNHQPVIPHSANLIYSPDNSRERLTQLISAAKNKINMYAQDVSDYKLTGTLARAAKKGVQINIITSKTLREKQANYLSRAGIHIYYDKKLYIHAKAMTIDDKEAVIGSINLTRASLENNRELAVISHDPAVIRALNTQFEKDMTDTDRVKTRSFYSSRESDRVVRQVFKLIKQVAREIAKGSS